MRLFGLTLLRLSIILKMTTEIEIVYGQLVIGPAGSGKTSFCKAMYELLQNSNREVVIVNLDPDNESMPFTANVDISELVKLEDVMQNENLGPNGSFLFCIDLLNQNFEWFHQRIVEELNKAKAKITKQSNPSTQRKPYLIFDCPGQIELFTNYPAFKEVITRLSNFDSSHSQSSEKNPVKSIDLRLVTVNLVDSFHASDPSKFITVVLNSLISMLHIETPFVNILSKIDLIENNGNPDFGVDFYCELPDFSRLVERISEEPFLRKFKKLTESLASIIENYGLVSYAPLDVKNQNLLIRVLGLIDSANGFDVSNMSSKEDVHQYYRTIQADFEASKYGDLI